MIEVIEVRKSLDDFIAFPLQLYSNDPLYVPQLTREMKVHFSEKNPFFHHAKAKYFIAKKDGATAGRIISFVNRMHNELHKEKTGFFGFFECVDDQAAANALFDIASEYLRQEGMETIRGPMNFSTNEECGFLLEGFTEPPFLMMPYNPPYFNAFAENYGMKKIKDLYAYIYEVQDELPEKVIKVADVAEKKGIKVRRINMKIFRDEMKTFQNVYNSAWEKNWGFIPMTDNELEYASNRLKQIVVPEMTLIAEKDNEPVGFMGIVPDFNLVLRYMKGRLNPVSIAKGIYYSKKITDLRLMLLGIKKEYRNKGVDALMFREVFSHFKKGGYKRIEFSWILEDNIPVRRLIEMADGRLYKKYRIYEKTLD